MPSAPAAVRPLENAELDDPDGGAHRCDADNDVDDSEGALTAQEPIGDRNDREEQQLLVSGSLISGFGPMRSPSRLSRQSRQASGQKNSGTSTRSRRVMINVSHRIAVSARVRWLRRSTPAATPQTPAAHSTRAFEPLWPQAGARRMVELVIRLDGRGKREMEKPRSLD